MDAGEVVIAASAGTHATVHKSYGYFNYFDEPEHKKSLGRSEPKVTLDTRTILG